MIKIVLTGPESTGKSTLARALAEHYSTVAVPEYARFYIDQLGGQYEESDLRSIALGQAVLEEDYEKKAAAGLMFCDTSMLVLKVWSVFKYNRCDQFIADRLQLHPPQLYILCGIDVPWEYDPQRENPIDRDTIYKAYLYNLSHMGVPFIEIEGNQEERLATAINHIDALLRSR